MRYSERVKQAMKNVSAWKAAQESRMIDAAADKMDDYMFWAGRTAGVYKLVGPGGGK